MLNHSKRSELSRASPSRQRPADALDAARRA